jgi:hypothetical protein
MGVVSSPARWRARPSSHSLRSLGLSYGLTAVSDVAERRPSSNALRKRVFEMLLGTAESLQVAEAHVL